MSTTKPSFDDIRENFIPPKQDHEIQTDVPIPPPTILKPKIEPTIVDQMVSYDPIATDAFIQQLDEELHDQLLVNDILKQKNYDANKTEIESFVQQNKHKVSDQLSNLEQIFQNLKNVHKENLELKLDQHEYDEIMNSEEVKNISEDMRKLKNTKNKVMLFLQQNGIHVTL